LVGDIGRGTTLLVVAFSDEVRVGWCHHVAVLTIGVHELSECLDAWWLSLSRASNEYYFGMLRALTMSEMLSCSW